MNLNQEEGADAWLDELDEWDEDEKWSGAKRFRWLQGHDRAGARREDRPFGNKRY